jgi:phosphate transport system protein
MREAFHEQLDSVFEDLAAIARRVEDAVRVATEALLTGDAEIAERVISADIEVDRARERVEDKAHDHRRPADGERARADG